MVEQQARQEQERQRILPALSLMTGGEERAVGTASVAERRGLHQRQLLPLHIGATVGPLGSWGLSVIFHQLTVAFGVDRAALSLAIPAYMFAFAGAQLFSGSISDLTSRRTTALLGFFGYGLATAIAGLSWNLPSFLLSQVLQGLTNAFMTPILMATIGDAVEPAQHGRAMGIFTSLNTSGMLLGPLLAGAVGPYSWRAYYFVSAGWSVAIGLWLAWGFSRYAIGTQRAASPDRFTALRQLSEALRQQTRLVLLLAGVAFLTNAAGAGANYLFGEYLRERWQTPEQTIGILLSLYGLAGLLVGPLAGMLVDRLGIVQAGWLGETGMALALVLLALAPTPWLFGLGNFLLGTLTIASWAAINTLAITALPEYRGTLSAYVGVAKFLAQGVAPSWFTPLYQHLTPRAIFPGAALPALLTLPLLFWLQQTRRGAGQPVPRRPEA